MERTPGLTLSSVTVRLMMVALFLGLWFGFGGLATLVAALPTAGAADTGQFPGMQQQETPTATATLTPTLTMTPTVTPAPIAITAVEPARISTVTGGILTVLGHGFTPGIVIRLVGYGLLETTFVNSQALTGVVPPGVPPDRYDVQVGVGEPEGDTAVRPDALQIEAAPAPTHTPAPTNTPVPTDTPIPTATAAFVFGQPQLTIQSIATTPELLPPGQPFELLLEIANLGAWTAVDASVEMQSPELAIPATGSNARILPRLGPGDVVTTTLSLVVHEEAPRGAQNLNFHLGYFDTSGRDYSAEQSVGIFIGEAPTPTPNPGAAQPLLLLTAYSVEPDETLKPGGTYDLTLAIANVGDVATSSVVIRLGGEEAPALDPFVLLGSGNVHFVDRLDAGEHIEVTQQMLVAGTAAAGVFDLPIEFTYRDGAGEERVDSQVINLLVQQPPLLQVDFYRPAGPGMVGQPLDLPVEVVNIGRTLINVSTMTLSSPGANIENNRVYVGPLDGGTSGSLDGLVIPQTGGELPINVTVNYLDDFNQPQSYEATLTVPVEEPVAPEGPPGSPRGEADTNGNDNQEGFVGVLWRFIKGILGLGS